MATYVASGTVLNALLYANLKYSHIPEFLEIIDCGMEIVLLYRVIALILACIFNFLELFKYRKNILDELNENEGFNILYYDNSKKPI